MYKVLIIDDERPARRAIRLLGNWAEYSIEDIAEASDGKEGLDKVEQQKPDIVFVDMKMPLMNGIDFLRMATQIHPKAKYIVISGFQDFDYTKQAIKSKVLDYLLKPVVGDELNLTLKKAIEQLKQEQIKEEADLAKGVIKNISIPIIKEKVITRIIETGSKSFTSNEEWKKVTEFEDAETLYKVAILRVRNFKNVCFERFENDSNSFYFAITNVIDELCTEWSNCFSYKNNQNNHEVIIVLAFKQISKEKINSLTMEGLKRVSRKLRDMFGVENFISVSEDSSQLQFLNQGYESAKSIINNLNILNNIDSLNTEIFQRKHIEKIAFISEKRDLLFNAFETGSFEFVKKIVYDHLQAIKQSEYFSIEDAEKSVLEYNLLVEDVQRKLKIPGVDQERLYKRNDYIIQKIYSFEDLSEYVNKLIDDLFQCIKESSKSSEKACVHEIKRYIDYNYFKEIRLNMFSEKYYMSREHLCRIFKETYGCGIHEYALKIRMEKAKDLLNDENMKVQIISRSLGYADNNYFSKAFKKYFGITPSEYRKK